jgi:4-hydroxybenzoate polyprenyltransferase
MLIDLLRTKQWYKNTIIFLAIIFSGNLFDFTLLNLTVLGFISLCFMSSANYIINDIIDIKKDRKHPEKKFRPIAAGKIKITYAVIIAAVLFLISTIMAFILSIKFLFAVLALFILTTLYTFFFKKIPFLDIFIIATNFAVRAIAGALLINVWISPFLVLCPFFLSLFLSSGKRYSDMILLKKKTLYEKDTLKFLIKLFLITLILTFTIYCILVNILLLITLPLVIPALQEYYKLILAGSKATRHPEFIFKNKKLVFLIIIFALLLFLILYKTIFF